MYYVYNWFAAVDVSHFIFLGIEDEKIKQFASFIVFKDLKSCLNFVFIQLESSLCEKKAIKRKEKLNI